VPPTGTGATGLEPALYPHDSFTHETLKDLIAGYSGAQN
jgi:hypothetical protein